VGLLGLLLFSGIAFAVLPPPSEGGGVTGVTKGTSGMIGGTTTGGSCVGCNTTTSGMTGGGTTTGMTGGGTGGMMGGGCVGCGGGGKVPEIDPNTLFGGLTLAIGGALVLTDRFRRSFAR
jgi:hypothetical protein